MESDVYHKRFKCAHLSRPNHFPNRLLLFWLHLFNCEYLNRSRIWIEKKTKTFSRHLQVFSWVLGQLLGQGWLDGNSLGEMPFVFAFHLRAMLEKDPYCVRLLLRHISPQITLLSRLFIRATLPLLWRLFPNAVKLNWTR